MAKKKKLPKSKMTYEEKKAQAEIVLRRNGYNDDEVAEIIKKSFGNPPKAK